MKVLVATEKIPNKEFVKWIEAAGQHWLSGRLDRFPSSRRTVRAFDCLLTLFLTLVLEHFGVKLVNLVPNSIAMLSMFVYLCEAYLRILLGLELF